MYADACATGEAANAEITEKAQAEATEMIAKAKVAIEAERSRLSPIFRLPLPTPRSMSPRLIGEDLTEGEHRAITDAPCVRQVASLPTNRLVAKEEGSAYARAMFDAAYEAGG